LASHQSKKNNRQQKQGQNAVGKEGRKEEVMKERRKEGRKGFKKRIFLLFGFF